MGKVGSWLKNGAAQLLIGVVLGCGTFLVTAKAVLAEHSAKLAAIDKRIDETIASTERRLTNIEATQQQILQLHIHK